MRQTHQILYKTHNARIHFRKTRHRLHWLVVDDIIQTLADRPQAKSSVR